MISFICDRVIDFDATQAYEAKDIEEPIARLKSGAELGRKVVVVLRSAHYLTTQAFVILYNYIQTPAVSNIVLVLVSTDQSRI
ncbi:hypothetical protein [Scytonema sp. NUACC26]|uniref:hypothetical protein n=1 Tax=Scytonema sp. NUACC26 TaxID=3140176 RepID=UPI0034DC5D19